MIEVKTMYKIHPVDVIAALFIKKLSYDETQRTVSYQEINNLGCKVVNLTKQRTGISTIFDFWRGSMASDLYYNSDYFEEIEDEQGVRVKEGVTDNDLVNRFVGYLPLDILISFSEATKE